MVMMNVFQQDAFRAIQLTQSVEKVPYIPNGLDAMKIFTDTPVRTEAMAVEQRQGVLSIVPFSPRGSAGGQRTTEKRTMRYFEIPRIREEDTIYAREIAGIRAFGTESELMQVQAEVSRRLIGPTGLRSLLNFTQEFHKLAAVQGKLLDADGSVKFDWFAEFGITPPPQVVFDLAAGTLGSIRPLCGQLARNMARKAQGAFTNSTSVVALCGDAFFDKLVTHPDVEKTYANWQAAQALREGTAFKSDFVFGDITWVNYRGSDDVATIKGLATNGNAVIALPANHGVTTGTLVTGPYIPAGTTVTIAANNATLSSGNFAGPTGNYFFNFGLGSIGIPANKAKFFPKGAPGVFQRGLSPSDSIEFANTLGKPEYVNVIPDRDRNEWVKLEMTSYPLHICTRPEVLFTGTMDNADD
jgi:hypothetical protein